MKEMTINQSDVRDTPCLILLGPRRALLPRWFAVTFSSERSLSRSTGADPRRMTHMFCQSAFVFSVRCSFWGPTPLSAPGSAIDFAKHEASISWIDWLVWHEGQFEYIEYIIEYLQSEPPHNWGCSMTRQPVMTRHDTSHPVIKCYKWLPLLLLSL